jgi:hypothetical protein
MGTQKVAIARGGASDWRSLNHRREAGFLTLLSQSSDLLKPALQLRSFIRDTCVWSAKIFNIENYILS